MRIGYVLEFEVCCSVAFGIRVFSKVTHGEDAFRVCGDTIGSGIIVCEVNEKARCHGVGAYVLSD